MNAYSSDPAQMQVETTAARVAVAPVPVRLSLRARGDLGLLDAALGVPLPRRIGETVTAAVEIACLGPDEWVILADDAGGLLAACADVYPTLPHSLVDISGRETTFVIEGPRAADLLTLGCPRDIAAIANGTARRTLFDGATVTLWRDGDSRFRMDVWNSFAPHLFGLLDTGCRELAAE